jgi:hypothetical protein
LSYTNRRRWRWCKTVHSGGIEATRLALYEIAGQQTRAHQATVVALEQIAQAEALLLQDRASKLANRRRQEDMGIFALTAW